jgi:hypothetical protein
MAISKATYRKIVTAAYAFFIGIALTWFLTSFFVGHTINYVALGSLAAFCMQAWYKNRVVNLTLGIIILPASIFGELYFLAWGLKSGFDAFIGVMATLALISLVFSIFLVFSYLKMSFDNN